jgi:RNA polymerase sigma factor (sigma-70 family)
MSMDLANPQRAALALTTSDLERLIHQHGRRLRNFIRRRVANAADVEDLMQDTYLETLRCLDRYRGTARPETWMFGIALNLVRNHYKRAAHRPLLEDEALIDAREQETAQDPLDILEQHQVFGRLSKAMDRLPQESVTVLTLVIDERLTYEQAAERLRIPVGTVRSRLSRARAILKGVQVAALGGRT